MPHPLTTPYEEARALLLAAAEAGIPELEHLPLSDALGRVLAVDQTSPFNLPQTDNAAVDGYAVHAAFLAAHPDHLFDIIGTARAGHPFEGKAEPGQAVQVFTGAVMPDGPDCVLMHEDCHISADGVICGKQLKTGTNMRPAGKIWPEESLLLNKAPASAQPISASWRRRVVQRSPCSGRFMSG